jgi:hypothetical protein
VKREKSRRLEKEEIGGRQMKTRLLRNSSLIWPTSLFPEHRIALLMPCVESATDVLLPDISLINYAMSSKFVTA